MTPMQEKIVATRLASRSTTVFLSDGALLSANALARHGLINGMYWSSLTLEHLSDTLINEFYNRHPSAFIAESLHGELLVFDNRQFFMQFTPNDRAKAERVVLGLAALELPRAA